MEALGFSWCPERVCFNSLVTGVNHLGQGIAVFHLIQGSPPRNRTPWVGRDRGHLVDALEHRQYVLDKHQIRILALFQQPDGKATGVVDVFLM